MENGKVVLITGASSGIGYELSRVFAGNNYNLILVSRNISKLMDISDDLIKEYGCSIITIQKDLAAENSAVEVYQEVINRGINVNVLVNNAGIGSCGLFHEISYDKDIEMISLNIRSLTILTKLFAKRMVELGNGKILNVASTGAYQPGPYIAAYYATKAYVLSFSEAIANELKSFGVMVSTLCPGATKTNFSRIAGKSDVKGGMSPKTVAEIAYRDLMKNKRIIVPGFFNKAAVLMTKLLPRKISAYIVGRYQFNLFKNFKNN